MANTDNGREAAELTDDPRLVYRASDEIRLEYDRAAHLWVTGADAEGVLRLLFERHRILFAILLAEQQTGLRLRPPTGKPVLGNG